MDGHGDVSWSSVVGGVVLRRLGIVENRDQERPLAGCQFGGEGVKPPAESERVVLTESVRVHGVCTFTSPVTRAN